MTTSSLIKKQKKTKKPTLLLKLHSEKHNRFLVILFKITTNTLFQRSLSYSIVIISLINTYNESF